jgi:hypothetical protein
MLNDYREDDEAAAAAKNFAQPNNNGAIEKEGFWMGFFMPIQNVNGLCVRWKKKKAKKDG